MRNLKKVLALVLALVMSLSLVTIANAADFSDSADINYGEAVDVMSTIGVIDGVGNNSFDPNGTLTREQAAKLIAYMLMGDNADKLGVESSSFKDVAATRWSAPAIEYCATLGIIDGAGDGNFYPAGRLTGYAFAKMLLTAIGYDSKIEGFTGNSWTINVATIGMEVGLHKGLEKMFGSAELSRQEAAQMALNAIKTPLVTYEKQATISVNGAEVAVGSAEAQFVTTTLAKEQRISNQRLTNASSTTPNFTVEFGEKYFPNLRLIPETDDFERPSHTWVFKSEEIGTYVDYDLLVETYTEAVTGRTLFELLGSSTIDKYSLDYYVDGVSSNGIVKNQLVRSNTSDLGSTGNGVLTQVFVDHDDEAIIITSINTWLGKANANYSANSESLSLKVYTTASGTTKTVDSKVVPAVEDVKKDDYVLVNMSGKETNGTRYDVVKISDVEIKNDSTVTKFSTDSTNVVKKLTTGGTEYKAAVKAFYDKGNVLDDYDKSLLTDSSYNIYMDQYGYVIGVDLYEGTKNYVFITGYDRGQSHISIKTADAAAIFLDGTMSEITVNVTDTNKNIDRMDGTIDQACTDAYYDLWNNAGDVHENRWYTYTVADNGVYTLKPVERMFATDYITESPVGTWTANVNATLNSANLYVIDNGTDDWDHATKIDGTRGRAYGNDNSVYITVEVGTVDQSGSGGTDKDAITDVAGVYTGIQNVKMEITGGSDGVTGTQCKVPNAVYTLYDSDRYIIASIILGEAQGGTNNYAYILSNAKSEERKDDGYYYWEFEAVLNGEKVTLTAKTKYTSVFSGLVPYTVQELRYDGEYVTKIDPVANTKFHTNNATNANIDNMDLYDVGHVASGAWGDTHVDYMHDTTAALVNGTQSGRIDGTIHLTGRTLYAEAGDVGLAVTKDCKAVLVQLENGSEEVRSFDTIDEAIANLADFDPDTDGVQFRGRIVAALKDGIAQWVVIISDTELLTGNGGNYGGESSNTKGGITVTALDSSVNARNVLTSITGSGNLNIAIPVPAGTHSADVTITLTVDKVPQTRKLDMVGIDGNYLVFETAGLDLSEANDVVVTISDLGNIVSAADQAKVDAVKTQITPTQTIKTVLDAVSAKYSDLTLAAPVVNSDGSVTITATSGTHTLDSTVDYTTQWEYDASIKADEYMLVAVGLAKPTGATNADTGNGQDYSDVETDPDGLLMGVLVPVGSKTTTFTVQWKTKDADGNEVDLGEPVTYEIDCTAVTCAAPSP